MNSKLLYFVFIAVLVLLGGGIFVSAYEANIILQNRSQKLTELKATNTATEQQQIQLAQNKRDIAKYGDLNKIAQTVVPQDKDQAEAVREIVKLAADSGIPQLTSITFPASTLGGTGVGASTIKTSNGLTQVVPVKGIPGVYDLQITVLQDASNKVPYSRFTTFLTKLEQNRRTAQVSSITVQPDTKNTNFVSFTLIIDEFIKP